jgi:hypothetical protein
VRGHLRQGGDAYKLCAFVGRDPVSGRKKYVTRTFRGKRRDVESEIIPLSCPEEDYASVWIRVSTGTSTSIFPNEAPNSG